MIIFIISCLEFLVRWLHLIVGIAWIGSSFYFVWLDNSLKTPPKDKQDKGVLGDLWSIHGGGIYEIAKYKSAPATLPEKLHWFKWEAYATWITGMLLMFLFYYVNAELYLVGGSSWLTTPSQAIAASLGFLFFGVLLHEVLMRFICVKNKTLFSILFTLAIFGFCWLSCQLFGNRAAFLHVGAVLGSIMAANVFLGIIPAQKYFVACLEKGETPLKEKALNAKTRSVNNNYLTLPVIFCMISNHYSFLYGHPFNWLVLFAIMALSAYARHFFNLKHRGIIKPSVLVFAFLGFVLLMAATYKTNGIPSYQETAQEEPTTTLADKPLAENDKLLGGSGQSENIVGEQQKIMALVNKHCLECHAAQPTSKLFSAPPAGIVFDTAEQVIQQKASIITAVSSNYMPLGNMTSMTDEERKILIQLLYK